MQCKLVYDRGSRSYELHVPFKRRQHWAHAENQGCANAAIALDPGVRTFLTGYSPDGKLVEFAPGAIARLCRLSAVVDRISAKIDDTNDTRHRQRQRLKRKRLRLHTKITHLVDEVHWKSADYLCKHYDVILLPSFGTSGMVRRSRRKINRNTARRMLLWSHYRFKLRLKARQWGRTVVVVNEAYTSKTCGRCGWQHHTLGGSKVFQCGACGLQVGRDFNGARNILLRNVL